jgi:hypothetical protein
MKHYALLLSTVLSTSAMLSGAAYAADDTITSGTVTTAESPISKAAVDDPRVAASGFVEHVNFARVSLAMKNVELAKQHITQARNMVTLITGAPAEKRLVKEVESGRIMYQYDTEYKYHYFPIETGPVQVKQISNGSIWAKNDLAVTDADIVYLTLDLTNDKAETYLAAAEKAITANNLKEADAQLAKLTDAVVTVDSRMSMPSDKARDNIALARNFIAGKNYEGAKFALKHADEALDEMQNNDEYKIHRANIIILRQDVKDLQGYIEKRDPTMIQKADAKMDKWWKEMKSWAKSSK